MTLFPILLAAAAPAQKIGQHAPSSPGIGGALVGTFLGVFLAYGIMGPFAARVKTVVEDDGHFYQLVREVLVANLHRHAPNICIEVGRQNTPHHVRPSFAAVEESLRALKQEAA